MAIHHGGRKNKIETVIPETVIRKIVQILLPCFDTVLDFTGHYVLFPDVTNAQKLYDILKDRGIKCTFAPTPREADKCCGVCVMFYDENAREMISKIVDENGIKILKFFDGSAGNPERMKFC